MRPKLYFKDTSISTIWLSKHKRVDHRNQLFECSYEGCDRPGYKSRKSLNAHIRSVHTHIRPYVCNICGKAFATKNGLREHRFTHSIENAFHCKCGNKFRHKSSLNKHKRMCLFLEIQSLVHDDTDC
ncbi:hypothetical protein KIN20_025455 [Parelaphostrongylus tenuis]|uniref:C2H2-type domain-containing protein n=1 Tax=Parelaphostrongylus tenuis TaxID=148309 RepID=A0AAD5QX90_PARTN|nr:hypothetical protein KIN20_025455 [Parelaphostrongylus tenuis]